LYDSTPGSPVSTTIRFLDANGSPILSGIVGTMTLYSPSSTTSIGGPTSMAHVGDGVWGVTWAGSLTTALGDYRWVSSAITGTATLAAQAGIVIVGVGDAWSLRELYTAVRRALPDGRSGSSTGSGSTTTLVDTKFAYGATNRWASSELFLFEPQLATDTNPVRVTANTTGGTFTFTPAITSTVAGLDFWIGNVQGQGWEHAQVLDAIVTAIRRQRALRPVVDQVALTAASGTFEYAQPAGWLGVSAVEYQPDAGYATLWRPLPPHYQQEAGPGRFSLLMPPPNNALRVRGWAAAAAPQAMGALVYGDGATLRDDAIYELLLQRAEPEHRQRAQMMQGAVLRARAGASLARL